MDFILEMTLIAIIVVPIQSTVGWWLTQKTDMPKLLAMLLSLSVGALGWVLVYRLFRDPR